MNRRLINLLTALSLVLGGIAPCIAGTSCAPAKRPPSRPDLPPFYDRSNVAEYYGRCPRCNEWVRGYLGTMHGTNAEGRPTFWHGYSGECLNCGANVYAEGQTEHEARILKWQLIPSRREELR